jgi:hypothetical protein
MTTTQTDRLIHTEQACIQGTRGYMMVTAEPLDDSLAITPQITMDGGVLWFTGSFAITATCSGLAMPAVGCIICAREAGKRLVAVDFIDWELDAEEIREVIGSLPTEQMKALQHALAPLATCSLTHVVEEG